MIQQARQRMSEAHQRAHPVQAEPEKKPEPAAEPQPVQNPGAEPVSPENNASADSSRGEGMFSSLFRDKDRTIILALMLLLADENGDNSLLFALMYLLMD